MIKFILKGVFRDHHRSLFPVLIVTIGVTLTIIAQAWVNGVFSDMIEFNARFKTGHVRILTKGYAENLDQLPNDYALLEIDSLISRLQKDYPQVTWARRTQFGGLIDIPDESGETRIQGPALGLALDILSKNSLEIQRLNLKNAIKQGRLPTQQGEILLSEQFAQKLGVQPGDIATLITATMYGSMAISNYVLSGTVEFGTKAMDKGAVIMDITDAQILLNMENGTGELLGYLPSQYDPKKATQLQQSFTQKYSVAKDETGLVMLTIKDDEFLGGYLEIIDTMAGAMIFIFLLIMSVVLWNSGLLGALRRYGEVGVRLAIGESKNHVYESLILESLAVGIIGSVIGTGFGLLLASLLEKGIDVGDMMQNSTIMMQSVFRGKITPATYYIGFVPGIFSTMMGTILSGIGIYKRQTAQLFKELEA